HWPNQIFWIVVFFALTYFLTSRFVVPHIGGILEERDRRINSDLEKAESLKDEAGDVKAEYEAAIAKAREAARAEIKAAQAEIAQVTTEREAGFAGQMADRLSDAEKRIAAAKAEAMKSVESIA